MNKLSFLKRYFVAGSQDCQHLNGNNADNLLRILENALNAGITCFQFREKGKNSLRDPDAISALAQDCQKLCAKAKVPFIINNDVDLALKLNADGIHVGQSDMPIVEIIPLFKHKIIGLSCQTLAQAQLADRYPEISYLGVGPIFSTNSKEDAGNALHPDIIRQLKSAHIRKPLVAIGGISLQNIHALKATHPDGIAVISMVTKAHDLSQIIPYW